MKLNTITTPDFINGPTSEFWIDNPVSKYSVETPKTNRAKQTKIDKDLRIFVPKYGFYKFGQMMSAGSSAGFTVKLCPRIAVSAQHVNSL
jgi:hypothetical protein